jgi:S1-C subfamily serine protease
MRGVEETLNRLRGAGPSPQPDSSTAPPHESPPQPPPAYPTTVISVRMGLTCRTVTPDTARELKLSAPRGLWCTGVTVGGAAANAGIRPDDVLLTVNGSELRDLTTLETIASTTPHHAVPAEIFRNGQLLSLHLAFEQLRR